MPSETFQPRQPYQEPTHHDGGRILPEDLNHRVCLRHPGYNDGTDILMVLPALDHPEGGIHHETARIACALIANNRWEGFLTETRTGARLDVGRDEILRGRNYYFRVSEQNATEKYAVIPSFSHWRFPHDNLPESWTRLEIPKFPSDRQLPRQSSLAEASLARDISCRITNHVEGTEHAHLVPRSEERWFSGNGMFRYTNQQRPGTEPVDDAQNAVLLRSDLHTIFDQKRFAITPKSSTFVLHIFAPGSSLQLAKLYHNVSLQPLVGVAIHYILARFAWTVFAQLANFLQQGLRRTLCVYAEDGEGTVADFSGDQCRQLITAGTKSRSQSARKRQREIPTVVTETKHSAHGAEWGESLPEEDVRGRKRRRSDDPLSQNSYVRDPFWSPSENSTSEPDMDEGHDTSESVQAGMDESKETTFCYGQSQGTQIEHFIERPA